MGCASSAAWSPEPKQEFFGDTENFHQRYTLGSKLGEGSFGQVRSACHRGTREVRAVKVVSLLNEFDSLDQSLLRAARCEARIWRLLGRHEHCVELHEAFMDHSLYYMVMEKCEASLMDQLQEMPRMSEGGVARVFREMLLGIGHVHAQAIVHRDVKPNNFLFGGSSGGTVKLCDFGMAALLPRRRLLYGSYGTAPYMSPEMIGDRGHALSTDVWSFGATAYVLLYGDFPYVPLEASAKAMKAAVLKGSPAPRYQRCSPDMPPPTALAEAFVRALLEREPRLRRSVEEALQLPFLRRELVPPASHSAVVAVAPPAGGKAATAVATAAGPATAGAGGGAGSAAAAAIASVMRSLSVVKGKEAEVAVEEGLAPVLREARKLTHLFKAPVNPTVQRSLDELLKRLQDKGNESFLARSFSEPAASDALLLPEEEVEPAVLRRESKSSTHSGVLYTMHGCSSSTSTRFPGSTRSSLSYEAQRTVSTVLSCSLGEDAVEATAAAVVQPGFGGGAEADGCCSQDVSV